MHSLQRKVLRTICPDQKGLIARITNICYKHELNIVQNNEFVDHRTGRFFMRTELEGILMIPPCWRISIAHCQKAPCVS
ncbi:formyltetrahydrofolate deformylase [Escherichia coli]|nr:formyltetrahydrofolate deformylase [Escherichia coli]